MKYTLIILVYFSFMFGCIGNLDSEIVCNEPYIRYGADCCLDVNSNFICDDDEAGDQEQKNEIGQEKLDKKTLDGLSAYEQYNLVMEKCQQGTWSVSQVFQTDSMNISNPATLQVQHNGPQNHYIFYNVPASRTQIKYFKIQGNETFCSNKEDYLHDIFKSCKKITDFRESTMSYMIMFVGMYDIDPKKVDVDGVKRDEMVESSDEICFRLKMDDMNDNRVDILNSFDGVVTVECYDLDGIPTSRRYLGGKFDIIHVKTVNVSSQVDIFDDTSEYIKENLVESKSEDDGGFLEDKFYLSDAYWTRTAKPFSILEHSQVPPYQLNIVIQNKEAEQKQLEKIIIKALGSSTSEVVFASDDQDRYFSAGEKRTITVQTNVNCTRGNIYEYDIIFDYCNADATICQKQFGEEHLVGKCA